VTVEERRLVDEMQQMALDLFDRSDSKAEALFVWIEEKLRSGGKWNDERLLVFTEYKDTLEYLRLLMEHRGWGDRILTLYGGMPEGKEDATDIKRGGREFVKKAFRAPPSQEPMRILLATDAASEGLNLQEHCRYLVHYEIPWNPNRMEQRNGRIDRHGQKAEEVYCHHFVYQDHEDSKFLQTVVDKVQTMRHDLGSVGDVIAGQVEEAR
jgi:ERCC4-related helicase